MEQIIAISLIAGMTICVLVIGAILATRKERREHKNKMDAFARERSSIAAAYVAERDAAGAGRRHKG